MVCATWLLLSCHAEDLGISLPPKGSAGIMQEDLKRDLWLAENEHGEQWFIDRMKQMDRAHYSTKEGLCVGNKTAPKIIVVEQNSLSSNVAKAVLISLAKAMHKGSKTWDLCVYTDIPTSYEWWIGDLSGGEFIYTDKKVFTKKTALQVREIDFRVLRKETQNLAKTLGIP